VSTPSQPPLPLGDVDVRDVWSTEVDDTFRVFVGHCGSRPEGVLFVTDANGLFGLAVDTVRMMQLPAMLPSMLVIGIGYPTAATIAETIDLRVRDLTPTASSRFKSSGGADPFLRFIRTELMPTLQQSVESYPKQSIYFGHSLGGLLGVHALLNEQQTFDHHIVSSPSLWWDHQVMFERERQRSSTTSDLRSRVFFGIGSEETDSGRRAESVNLPPEHPAKPPASYLDMVDDMSRFVEALTSRNYPGLALRSVIVPDEYHATVAATVLNRGLRHVFAG
jgi:predicted alpha/beta superfamily hydrolase